MAVNRIDPRLQPAAADGESVLGRENAAVPSAGQAPDHLAGLKLGQRVGCLGERHRERPGDDGGTRDLPAGLVLKDGLSNSPRQHADVMLDRLTDVSARPADPSCRFRLREVLIVLVDAGENAMRRWDRPDTGAWQRFQPRLFRPLGLHLEAGSWLLALFVL